MYAKREVSVHDRAQLMNEETTQQAFKNAILLYSLGFLAVALIEIPLAVSLEKYYAEVFPSGPARIAGTFVISFAIGLAVSAVLGVWIIRPISGAITRRVTAEGSLISRQGSLFRDFGMVLGVTVWVVINLAVTYFCYPVLRFGEGAEAAGRLVCYFLAKSVLIFVAGLAVGFLTWLYFWSLRFEKRTGSQIFITRYESKKWSMGGFLGIAAVVLIVIIVIFYRLFTLE